MGVVPIPSWSRHVLCLGPQKVQCSAVLEPFCAEKIMQFRTNQHIYYKKNNKGFTTLELKRCSSNPRSKTNVCVTMFF
ncbi:hypothetical protein Hanom_Chr16g01440381 [Helianthus anomalus]